MHKMHIPHILCNTQVYEILLLEVLHQTTSTGVWSNHTIRQQALEYDLTTQSLFEILLHKLISLTKFFVET